MIATQNVALHESRKQSAQLRVEVSRLQAKLLHQQEAAASAIKRAEKAEEALSDIRRDVGLKVEEEVRKTAGCRGS